MSRSERLYRWAPLLVALLALLVYANAAANGFALDDGLVIKRNPLLQAPSGLWRAWVNPWWPAAL